MGQLKPIRMAVIGVGALGRHHARILAGMQGVDLVAVADPNAAQAQAVAEQHQTDWVTDYTEILDQVDAVSLVAPTFLHYEIAADCLARGKDILVEKPLTADVPQAQKLTELSLDHDCILQVGHIERFNPAFEVLCDSITSVPRYIRAERLSPFPFRSLDIGAVHDLMIHDIELVLHLTGSMPTLVESFGSRLMGAHEDTVQTRLHFAGGCIADITASRVNPEPRRCISVWTNTENISADLQTRSVSIHRPTSKLLNGPAMEDRMRAGEDVTELKTRVFSEFIETETVQASAEDALTAELQEFTECVRSRQQPRVDGKEGTMAVQTAERVLQSMLKNCVNHRAKAAGEARAA
ncbi:Gfo/Idh/MocA family oxidoreductase [Rubinisphaera margarita]|uniref:Gfo/Idh/MocA family oxidoreductase n=1 Tax=Rubinisphaera margarita TaxID=2909586 RepID=UPI001EE89661|nr:Gfo/Idh/MocA family oxidoreductase [Rubinisphaera margarita]MCG6157576.1 Gfo/Idh/MocA family oxidoreductase [Rubinisphaera margarita]